MKVHNNIRHYREFKGYSQQYVAAKLGKSQAAYSKIENGHIKLSSDNIVELSKILQIPEERLFEEENLSLRSINESSSELLRALSENRNLLTKVETNQLKLQQQINTIFLRLNER